MQLEDDSLWESFPQILEMLDGAKRYINAFRALLQELINLKSEQVHALRACSLVAIPPSMEGTPPPGGFPRDLSELNLSSWAGLIQDVAQGLWLVPPNLNLEVCHHTTVLLQLLEATTGVGYCRFCCWPSPWCTCLGAHQRAPDEAWSQMMEQIPGHGVAASSRGPTTPSTATAEAPKHEAPPPGLTLLDFSNWNLPPLGTHPPRGLPAASGGLPSIGRSDMIRQVAGPQAPGQQAPVPPMTAPCAPQVAPPVHQPQPRNPATPYQQAVQPPRRPMGRGVATELPSNRAAPVAGQPTQDCGRQLGRGRGDRGRSASCPRDAQGTTSNVPLTTTPGATQSQPGSCTRCQCPDPALLVAKFCSDSWRKDLEHVLKVYYKHNLQAPFRESEWVRVRELFFDHFLPQKDEALAIKERSPLEYMPLVAEEFWRAVGLRLHRLPEFTLWIKRGSYYHGLLLHQDQLQSCPHLIWAPLPRWPQPKPSESCRDLYKRAEGLVVSSSEPSAGATTAPTQETLAEEPPVAEAPASDTPHSGTPAPMETGGAGDGQSWAEQVEVGLEAEF